MTEPIELEGILRDMRTKQEDAIAELIAKHEAEMVEAYQVYLTELTRLRGENQDLMVVVKSFGEKPLPVINVETHIDPGAVQIVNPPAKPKKSRIAYDGMNRIAGIDHTY